MKHFFALAAALACGAAPAQPVPHGADLRRVLEQYHPASAPRSQAQAPVRHLTPDERLQLRRQLAEFKPLSLPQTSSPGPKTR